MGKGVGYRSRVSDSSEATRKHLGKLCRRPATPFQRRVSRLALGGSLPQSHPAPRDAIRGSQDLFDFSEPELFDRAGKIVLE